MTSKPWPTLAEERAPEQIKGFLSQAAERLHPSSNADIEERAWLTGQVLGLASWLVERMEKPESLAAVRATGRYFDALSAWTERSPLPGVDVVGIPAGSEPQLDLLCDEAIDATKAALIAIGDRQS